MLIYKRIPEIMHKWISIRILICKWAANAGNEADERGSNHHRRLICISQGFSASLNNNTSTAVVAAVVAVVAGWLIMDRYGSAGWWEKRSMAPPGGVGRSDGAAIYPWVLTPTNLWAPGREAYVLHFIGFLGISLDFWGYFGIFQGL